MIQIEDDRQQKLFNTAHAITCDEFGYSPKYMDTATFKQFKTRREAIYNELLDKDTVKRFTIHAKVDRQRTKAQKLSQGQQFLNKARSTKAFTSKKFAILCKKYY